MKKIVIYSSLTGNTAKVGHAIAQELGCEAVKFDVNWACFLVLCKLTTRSCRCDARSKS